MAAEAVSTDVDLIARRVRYPVIGSSGVRSTACSKFHKLFCRVLRHGRPSRDIQATPVASQGWSRFKGIHAYREGDAGQLLDTERVLYKAKGEQQVRDWQAMMVERRQQEDCAAGWAKPSRHLCQYHCLEY